MRVTDIIAQAVGATVVKRPGDVPLIVMPGAERHVGMPPSPPRPQRPKKVTLTEAEMLAIRNLLRITDDPFADVEEGAGVPLGTLDALNDRIAAYLGIR